ncbi:TPA: DNA gyrase subunit A [Candidatus Saccharibacteria bacterium]|nr:DNA gyrase subunit A [Candidatus Saccharibacteria bacterium]HIO87675.1 DNA gyrase subunit A [Candidatus Saccharibacteria bacterium]
MADELQQPDNDNLSNQQPIEGSIVEGSTEKTKFGLIKTRTLENEMEESYLQYSMSVIVARALPDVRDGMKPVHRRILYSMGQNGNRHNAKYTKSARIIGDVMGKYHPHGDSAIYDSMVRLAQPWAMRYMMVDGQGNFGSMDGDPPAAMRYTEARMMRPAEEMLADIDKDTVDFRDNFDGSEQEPSVLPARLPNLLLNGQIGIAVGMATNIPPHNLGEIVDATVEIIDNPEANTEDLLKHVQGPDFPTGGVVYGGDPLRAAYATGKGGITIRAVADIVEHKSKKDRFSIIVSEIPFAVNKASLIEKIADLVKDKKIQGISDLRDESSRGDVRIVVDLKKDSYPKKILNQLYKFTPLQTSFHYNMLALIDGIQPRVLGLKDMLTEFIKHRQNVVRRRTEFELKKAEARAHVLDGLKIALDNIDEIIATIRGSQTTEEAQKNLIKKFKLSEIQARAILAMQLRALAGLERQKIEDELAELKKLIAELKKILGDEKEILAIIKAELLEVKEKYGDERRTKIESYELGKFSEEQLIPNERVVIVVTKGNYIKRTPLDAYKKQNRGGKGKRGMTTKEEDVIEHLVMANTHNYLLFFTNKGRVFRQKAYEVPQAGPNAKGQAMVNMLQLHPDEIVTAVINLDATVKDSGFLFMTTDHGTVKKTPLSAYENVRQSGLIAINLVDGDELRWIRVSTGENDIIITTKDGQAIRFNEKDVRPMGRTARGVRGIKLRKDDKVISMDIVQEEANIFMISENGYGKRTKVDHFTRHRRGGVGIKAAVLNSKTGKLVSVKSLRQAGAKNKADEVIIISKNGQTIRLGISDISELGRTTQGVRIMKLNNDDKVASTALVRIEDEEDDESSEQQTDDKEAEKTPKKSSNKTKNAKKE